MAGRLGESGLGDEGVREVLDLCLECRACRAECPVGVDMARFKSEFLADYWRRHGTPGRARALGHIHELSRWGSRLAPLSNWIARSGPARWLNERFLGIDRRRTPPVWARDTFVARFKRLAGHGAAGAQQSRGVLFVDTFTNFYNPEIGVAAARVLEAAGVQAGLAPNVCCGRPLISQGLLDEARTQAAANADALYPLASSGTPLIFLEPSCLSALKEDAPALLRGEMQRRARRVAEACVLFEEYVEPLMDRLRGERESNPGPHIVLHGHCHQKAMGLVRPAKSLLARIPGATVTELDSGCCGMAGSFGYAREHFDVSRAIGERRLLPAARALPAGAVLVASGVSCRHQVADFTGVRALHSAELLHSFLVESS
jgi:Fe-S oxidoreductase